MSSNSIQTANRQIARATGTIMAAMIFSQLIGLFSKSLIAQTFGTSLQYDAYVAANRLTEILYNLVAGGALSSAFLPVFIGLLAKEQRPAAWKLASSITNLVTLALVVFSIISAVFAEWIVNNILAPGFILDNPAKAALTAHLLRIQLITPCIFGISGLLMGILNAHQHFLLPALAPCMYSIGKIFGVWLFAPHMGIDGLAWGIVLGASLHLLIQLPQFLRLPVCRYNPTLGLNSPLVREVGRLMAPRLLGVAFVQLNFLANTYLASLQAGGSAASLDYAFTIMLMPQAAIAQAIAIAALPVFSAQVALEKKAEMRSSLSSTISGVIMLSLPASVGLILLATPIVQIIYQYRSFAAESTQMVAWALVWYAAGLVGHSVVEIVSRAFYALHDTKTPVMVGVIAMSLNLAFSLLFSSLFRQWAWMPHGGLALANSLATFLEMFALLFFMRRRLQGLEDPSLRSALLKSITAALAMGCAVIFWQKTAVPLPLTLNILMSILIGVLVYGIALWLLKVPELRILLSWLRGQLQRRIQ